MGAKAADELARSKRLRLFPWVADASAINAPTLRSAASEGEGEEREDAPALMAG